MLTQYGVLKPDVPRAGYNEECYELWRLPRRLREESEWLEFFAKWKEAPHPFDPTWRAHLLSVQCVVDAGNIETFDPGNLAHWIWAATRVFFVIATALFGLGGMVLMFYRASMGLPY